MISNHFKLLIPFLLGVTVIGCSSTTETTSVDATASAEWLQKAEVCCKNFSQVAYEPVTKPGLYEYLLTKDSQALDLSTGKTFVKGIRLPENHVEDISIEVTASLEESVFVPNVMVLDSHFQPVTTYDSKNIDYDSSSLFNEERFERELVVSENHLKSGKAKYLIIYTTAKDMNSSTVLKQLDQGTIRVGRTNEPRMFGDVIIPHSALGHFQVEYGYNVTLKSDSTKDTLPVIQQAETDIVEIKQTLDEPAVANISGIQPETEMMYVELIEKAVRENKLEKALRFVEEGEKAGSTKLRDVFFNAIKKGQ